MRIKNLPLFVPIFLMISWFGCSQDKSTIYDSPSLKVKKISEHAFIHTSFLETKDYGKVPCNGMVLISDNEAVVLETPVDDEVSEELIKWIEEEKGAEIKAVIVHHFHIDCLGGLGAFHQRKIPSFATQLTIDMAQRNGYELPLYAMKSGHHTPFGNEKISSHYFGPAHTVDNVVSYFGGEKLLFGGCMIKSLNASKGNTSDADLIQWPDTVAKIKTSYPELITVVPGHGKEGGSELLDYTIDLFSQD